MRKSIRIPKTSILLLGLTTLSHPLQITNAQTSDPTISPAPSPYTTGAQTSPSGLLVVTSSISGHAFFDSSSDGTRDITNTLDYGIFLLQMWLFDCDTNTLLNTAETDQQGYYAFENLEGGRKYYVNLQTPSWYVVSEVWNGKVNDVDDNSGEIITSSSSWAGVDNAFDPSSGSTECVELKEGESKSMSAGLVFYIPPSVVPPPTTTTTTEPTMGVVTGEPTMGPIAAAVTSHPTLTPTVVVVATPSPTKATPIPTSAVPTKAPITTTESPVADSQSPTLPPNRSAEIGGYAFLDGHNNGYFDTSGPNTNSLDEGTIEGISVELQSCSDGSVLDSTTTNDEGWYSFKGIPPGSYTVQFDYCALLLVDDGDGPSDETCYVGSDTWVGRINVQGSFVAKDADSKADPATGRTGCEVYVAGRKYLDISVGMVDPDAALVPTKEPSEIPTGRPTSSPTKEETGEPTEGETVEPTRDPSEEPSKEPTVSPTQVDSEAPSNAGSNEPSTSTSPSDGPTPKISDFPSASPTSISSAVPSHLGTISSPPTNLPSPPPSRWGATYGPLTTERLVITIRGIEELHPDNAAWEAVTANFIQEYFNLLLLKEELGVWDVSVALKVVKIESSASGGKSNSIFDRRRNDYLGLRSREDGE